jgi:CheY-like chemotaxis protein
VIKVEKKILVVDDEKDLVYLLKTLLARHGYSVIEANSGEECLDILKKENPDLIFMDIMMPGMDGWETARRIKTDTDTTHIPIIMLSARSNKVDTKKSREYSFANEHLAKPINSRELIKTTESLILG